MIDTRILALVVGGSSLLFGGWSAIGDIPEMGLAAGVLGLFAGCTALLPRSSVDNSETLAGETAVHREGSDAPIELTDSETTPRSHGGATPPAAGSDDIHGTTVAAAAGDDLAADTPSAGASTGRTPETSLTDPVTGLFSEDYLLVALESRLASARRHLRPVAVALVEVTQGLPGDNARPADPAVVAEAVRTTIRDSDIACRLENGSFGVILEDTPENGAVWTVERIRRNLVSTSGHHTLWAGVACYPAHAFDSDDLMEQVRHALSAAQEWNQDRIEVAISE